MLANNPYQPSALIRFEQSLLNLGAALDQGGQQDTLDISERAVLEARRLAKRIEQKP